MASVQPLSGRAPLHRRGPAFRFVHFSIPHLPFVFAAEGYDPPADPLRQQPDTAYVRQLHYVDRLVGEIVGAVPQRREDRDTTIAIFGDHGFRGGGRETDVRHVPFIVKYGDGRPPRTLTEPVAGERMLFDVIAESCRVQPG